MNEEHRRYVSSKIRWLGDVPRVRRRTKLPTGVLVAIHTQDFRRRIIRNYWKIKAQAPRLAGRWRRGETIESIARLRSFSPIVIARIISSEIGVSKADFRKMVTESDIGHDLPKAHRRIQSEVSKVVAYDYMDSPWALELYRELGRFGEALLSDWLKERKLDFMTENDLKGRSGVPTPDFLFPSPRKIQGRRNISWIESKAFFGDLKHIRRHHRSQVSRYEKAYGDGMIVYWYGVSVEARKEGPIDEFLDPQLFRGRPGWNDLLEGIPSKLVSKTIQGDRSASG